MTAPADLEDLFPIERIHPVTAALNALSLVWDLISGQQSLAVANEVATVLICADGGSASGPAITEVIRRSASRHCTSKSRPSAVGHFASVGLRREDYGTHSSLLTKAAIMRMTRYLGVDIEDALALAVRTEVSRKRELLDLASE